MIKNQNKIFQWNQFEYIDIPWIVNRDDEIVK